MTTAMLLVSWEKMTIVLVLVSGVKRIRVSSVFLIRLFKNTENNLNCCLNLIRVLKI